ncbi:MAG: DUF4190 domain-containing protein [Planctomycetota bacterium]|nr:DUF4190 domain-containing protein [Planctomycetota bacterium]
MTQLPTGGAPASGGGASEVPGGPPPAMPKTSALAVMSLICGIASPCTAGLLAIPSLVLGIVGLARIRRSGGALAGRGMAMAGIIVSIVGLFFLLALVLVVLFVFCYQDRFETLEGPRGAIETPRGAAAESMIKMSAVLQAARDYADEHDGRLPPADAFPGALAKYLDRSPRDMLQLSRSRRLAMNAALAGLPLTAVSEPDRTVLFFEAGPDGPPVGGPSRLRPLRGPDDAYVIGFVSGRVAWVPQEDLGDLLWEPDRSMIRL